MCIQLLPFVMLTRSPPITALFIQQATSSLRQDWQSVTPEAGAEADSEIFKMLSKATERVEQIKFLTKTPHVDYVFETPRHQHTGPSPIAVRVAPQRFSEDSPAWNPLVPVEHSGVISVNTSPFGKMALSLDQDNRLDLYAASLVAFGPSSSIYALEAEPSALFVSGLSQRSSKRPQIAIKRLHTTSTARDRFIAESKALTRLRASTNSPKSIIQLLADPWTNKEGNDFAFFLPLAEENLEAFISRKERPIVDTESILSQFHSLAEGLAFIHASNIDHCAMNPKNILVFRKDRQVLFQVANFSHSICDAQIERGLIYADPEYSAPEVWNRSSVDLKACDVWALGAVFLDVLVFLDAGGDGVKAFRDKRAAFVGHAIGSTFHDGDQLREQVRDCLRDLHSVPEYAEPWGIVSAMLDCDPESRPGASEIRDTIAASNTFSTGTRDVSSTQDDILEIVDLGKNKPRVSGSTFSSHYDRLNLISRNSGLSLAASAAIFLVPVSTFNRIILKLFSICFFHRNH